MEILLYFQVCPLLWERFHGKTVGSWHRKIVKAIFRSYTHTLEVPGEIMLLVFEVNLHYSGVSAPVKDFI